MRRIRKKDNEDDGSPRMKRMTKTMKRMKLWMKRKMKKTWKMNCKEQRNKQAQGDGKKNEDCRHWHVHRHSDGEGWLGRSAQTGGQS